MFKKTSICQQVYTYNISINKILNNVTDIANPSIHKRVVHITNTRFISEMKVWFSVRKINIILTILSE